VFSYWLSNVFALPPLGAVFVIAGAILLIILGQLAAYVPARRAAAIAPAVATRTI
jgi:putative ABC transport system permease protein